MYHIEVITNKKLPWRKQRYHWRIQHYGDIILTSEMYYNLEDCRAVGKLMHSNLRNSTYKEL